MEELQKELAELMADKRKLQNRFKEVTEQYNRARAGKFDEVNEEEKQEYERNVKHISRLNKKLREMNSEISVMKSHVNMLAQDNDTERRIEEDKELAFRELALEKEKATVEKILKDKRISKEERRDEAAEQYREMRLKHTQEFEKISKDIFEKSIELAQIDNDEKRLMNTIEDYYIDFSYDLRTAYTMLWNINFDSIVSVQDEIDERFMREIKRDKIIIDVDGTMGATSGVNGQDDNGSNNSSSNGEGHMNQEEDNGELKDEMSVGDQEEDPSQIIDELNDPTKSYGCYESMKSDFVRRTMLLLSNLRDFVTYSTDMQNVFRHNYRAFRMLSDLLDKMNQYKREKLPLYELLNEFRSLQNRAQYESEIVNGTVKEFMETFETCGIEKRPSTKLGTHGSPYSSMGARKLTAGGSLDQNSRLASRTGTQNSQSVDAEGLSKKDIKFMDPNVIRIDEFEQIQTKRKRNLRSGRGGAASDEDGLLEEMELEDFGDIDSLLRPREDNDDWFEFGDPMGREPAISPIGNANDLMAIPEHIDEGEEEEGPAEHSFGTGFVVNEEGRNDFRIVSPEVADKNENHGADIVDGKPEAEQSSVINGGDNMGGDEEEGVEVHNMFGPEKTEETGPTDANESSPMTSEDMSMSDSEGIIEDENFDEEETWKVINYYVYQSRLEDTNFIGSRKNLAFTADFDEQNEQVE